MEAKVEKNESRNLPPTKVGISFAVLVMIVPSKFLVYSSLSPYNFGLWGV